MGLKNLTETELLAQQFLAINSPQGLADFLNIKYGVLIYHIHKVPESKKYVIFEINKRSGKKREIIAPISAIKLIQKNISQALYSLFVPRVCVHGYVKERNIKTNASVHANQRYILNLDLKDFFPSINFGRVRGLFMAQPFNFNEKVATVLAQICCFKNSLPQGAPSSPIISNLICLRMDLMLLKLASANKCYFTRYSDDLTFSTSKKMFPKTIINDIEKNEVKLNNDLIKIITSNGFDINYEKVKFQTKFQRQIVTGLIVNESPNIDRKYIRRVRAMLNAWKKYGLENASKEYFLKYDKVYRNPNLKKPSFANIVAGKVNYIRSIRKKQQKHDILSTALFNKLKALQKHEREIPTYLEMSKSNLPLIVTEGKTDWMHIENAWNLYLTKGKYRNIKMEFWKHNDAISMNDIKLKAFCKKHSHSKNDRKIICIFDRDSPFIINEMEDNNPEGFKSWGNNVYSFCIPVPSHRKEYKNISIEFYYSDDEIHTIDKSTGKQLLFTNEVVEHKDPSSKKRKVIKAHTFEKENENEKKIYSDRVDIVTDEKSDKFIAHSKSTFAQNILTKKEGFGEFNLDEFGKVFDIIYKICSS